MVSDIEPTEAVADHFRRWIKSGLTGCAFATALSRKRQRFVVQAFATEELALDHDAALDEYAASDQIVALILPWIRTEHELLVYLTRLASHSERWTLTPRKKRDAPD